MGSEIIVCGQRFDIGHPVRTFEDSAGFNAYLEHQSRDPSQSLPSSPAPGMEGKKARYRERRLLGGQRELASLRQVVRQVVTHFDGCPDVETCFRVLHDERGLSAHFLVDGDGTIYQTLDLVDCAFHAASVNETSVGIELQNQADPRRFPGAYRGGRPTVTCRVHDLLLLAYDFTDAQYVAMSRLSRALARILEIPLEVPRGADREQLWTTIPEPRRFAGFIGHYHVTAEKWDPGPWDFPRVFRRIGGRLTFPLTEAKQVSPGEATDLARLEAVADRYFEETEKKAIGYFPVGPLGESRLWHGGVHLGLRADEPVFAPIQGRIVAARMTHPAPAGSVNFVLLRHRLEVGPRALPFFSLYFHLREESRGRDGPEWLARNPRAAAVMAEGRVALLDDAIEAGEVIGRVGEAGPPELRAPQLHFAIFSEAPLGELLDPGYWRMIDDGGRGRFCRSKEIVTLIDRPSAGQPRDGLLSRRELARFFKSSEARQDLRRVVIHHQSEWTPGDWKTELSDAPDFAALSHDERTRLIEEQIEPTLWWTGATARHAGLPEDGMIYSYHPIGFLVWYAALLSRRTAERTAGIEAADAATVITADTSHFKLDTESTLQMVDAEDLEGGKRGQKLSLEELILGYPD